MMSKSSIIYKIYILINFVKDIRSIGDYSNFPQQDCRSDLHTHFCYDCDIHVFMSNISVENHSEGISQVFFQFSKFQQYDGFNSHFICSRYRSLLYQLHSCKFVLPESPLNKQTFSTHMICSKSAINTPQNEDKSLSYM